MGRSSDGLDSLTDRLARERAKKAQGTVENTGESYDRGLPEKGGSTIDDLVRKSNERLGLKPKKPDQSTDVGGLDLDL